MQGRLSPPVDDRIQSFPWATWESEFELAKQLGLSLIEWIVEAEHFDRNPLMSEARWQTVRKLQERTGVHVRTVCADCFMEWPLAAGDAAVRSSRTRILRQLIERCGRAGIETITLPFVDRSAIRDRQERVSAITALGEVCAYADEYRVDLALEMSLSPREVREFLEELDHPRARITYDMGNSASAGFDPAEEFTAFGSAIVNVHVKDRVLGGGTVPLGSGHVAFDSVFQLLHEVGYEGPLILQGARIATPIEGIQRYVEFLHPYVGLARTCS